ncbi:MAG: hypothetical protein ACPG4Q_09615 [Phycisphaeraceae bacterium]
MNDINTKWVKRLVFALTVVALVCLAPPVSFAADELEKRGMPVFFGDDDDGYGLIIYEYDAKTEAKFVGKKEIEHEVEFAGYLRPSDKDDVIGFQIRLQPTKAINDDGDDVLAGEGRGKRDMHTAVIARPDFQDRKGKPIEMAYVELSQCELDAPGAHVEDLELNAFAVVAEDRESEEFPAVVADRFQDVGHNVAIQVTSMEVKAKGLMIVKLDVKRSGGKSDTIVDSLYALNEDGDVIGGGRWINELDIFAKHCEYEMLLLLDDEVTITNFRVVLATKYEVISVPITVTDLYK